MRVVNDLLWSQSGVAVFTIRLSRSRQPGRPHLALISVCWFEEAVQSSAVCRGHPILEIVFPDCPDPCFSPAPFMSLSPGSSSLQMTLPLMEQEQQALPQLPTWQPVGRGRAEAFAFMAPAWRRTLLFIILVFVSVLF